MLSEKAKWLISSYKDYLSKNWIDKSLIVNEELMMISFFHKSYVSDLPYTIPDNERLEFLWDSILGCLIAKMLYLYFENVPESKLTLYKIALVREEMLAEVARDIFLDKMVFLGYGEEKTWWRNKDSILSDTLEALIWYIYLDIWADMAESFVKDKIFSKIENIKSANVKSYKTMVQEYSQKLYKDVPYYENYEHEFDEKWNIINYKCIVYINWEIFGEWYWTKKKMSNEEAAKNAYKKIQILNDLI